MPAFLIIVALAAGVPALLYLSWIVHCTLGRLCVRHARRFCAQHGWTVQRARWQPAFDSSGVKTEFTLVQLDCLDTQKQRRLVLLLVWPFGVRNLVTDEHYPASYGEQWPDTMP